MRIALYTPNHPAFGRPGGIGAYVDLMARALTSEGHLVHVIVPGDEDAQTVLDGVTIHTVRRQYVRGVDRVAPGMHFAWRLRRRMLEVIRDGRVQICEFPNWEGSGVLCAGRLPVPTVVRLSTTSREAAVQERQAPTWQLRWDMWRERATVLRADRLVTHSRAHALKMAGELRIDSARIAVSPLAVTVPALEANPPQGNDGLHVVYAGRLEARKGTVDLLHAIPAVLRSVPEARFTLIGRDRAHCPNGLSHAEYIQRHFSEADRRQVRLVGECSDEVRDALVRSADVFVAPSRYESFGLVFLEAMRWGVPVIGTFAGGIPEVVDHGRNGLLVDSGNPTAVAASLIKLLRDAPLRTALGRQARRDVEGRFAPDRFAGRTVEFFDDTIRAFSKASELFAATDL